jgi:hypothetical protein
MKKIFQALLIAVFGFGLIMSHVMVTNAFAKSCKKDKSSKRIRLECRAFGQGDTSMKARYKEKRNREKLSISFEAAPGGSFAAGDELQVTFNNAFLGSMILTQRGGRGDVEGDLDFDTKADSDDKDFPFPSIIVGEGDMIMVGGLGCELEN